MELLPGEIRNEIRKYLNLQERGRFARCCNLFNNEDTAIKIPEIWKIKIKENLHREYHRIGYNFCSNWVKVIETKKLPYKFDPMNLFVFGSFPSVDYGVWMKIYKVCDNVLIYNKNKELCHPIQTGLISWTPSKCLLQIWTLTICKYESIYNQKINKFEADTLEELYKKYGKVMNGEWDNYQEII